MELTQAYLKSTINYNEKTGMFTRKTKTSNSMRVGDIAGCKSKHLGYVSISVQGTQYYAHRLAYLYMTGNWPLEQIDHINGIRHDNTWTNLRPVTITENRQNQRIRKNCLTGIQGVKWMHTRNKWRARIGNVHLGLTADFFEACCRRKSAELKHGYHINHGH